MRRDSHGTRNAFRRYSTDPPGPSGRRRRRRARRRVDDGVVKVAARQGACRGCPMSQLTLANGVERVLKEQIPEVERVEPVVDRVRARTSSASGVAGRRSSSLGRRSAVARGPLVRRTAAHVAVRAVRDMPHERVRARPLVSADALTHYICASYDRRAAICCVCRLDRAQSRRTATDRERGAHGGRRRARPATRAPSTRS